MNSITEPEAKHMIAIFWEKVICELKKTSANAKKTQLSPQHTLFFRNLAR